MNNKGVTLIEMIGVVIILVIVLFLAIPSIKGLVARTKDQKYENIEKILETNMDLYILDHEEDMFNYNTVGGSAILTYEQLQSVNSDIDIEGCTINRLVVNRLSTCALPGGCEGEEIIYNHHYEYKACITCDDGDYVTNDSLCN